MRKLTFNNARIMRMAWTLQRETLRRFPGADRRATFTLCLREAWAEAKAAEAARAAQEAAQAAPETLEQFRTLPGEDQLSLLRKFAARCPSYAARTVRPALDDDGNRIIDPETGKPVMIPAPAAWADWMKPRSAGGLELEPWAVAVDTVAAEAWIGLDRQPEDLPLGIILARAAKAACMRLSRVYRDAPNNRKKSKTQDGKGTIQDPVSLDDPDYSGAARYPSPEAAVITREAVRTAARDDIDMLILDLRAQGYTLQRIAAAAGMSHPAVIKRLKKMQARLEDGGAAEAWLNGDDLRRPEQQPRPRTWTPDNAGSAPGTGSHAAPALPYGRAQAAGPVNGHKERAEQERQERRAAQAAQEATRAAAEAKRAEAWAEALRAARSPQARFAEGRR